MCAVSHSKVVEPPLVLLCYAGRIVLSGCLRNDGRPRLPLCAIPRKTNATSKNIEYGAVEGDNFSVPGDIPPRYAVRCCRDHIGRRQRSCESQPWREVDGATSLKYLCFPLLVSLDFTFNFERISRFLRVTGVVRSRWCGSFYLTLSPSLSTNVFWNVNG